MIKIKRVYEPPEDTDGVRVLVDRIWPRGLKKDQARINDWAKDLAPSDELRKWFGHIPERFEDFKVRYRRELERPEIASRLAAFAELGRKQVVTLLYGARDEKHNQAVVLKEVLESIGHRRR